MIVTVVSRVISCLGGVERFMTLDFKGSTIGFTKAVFSIRVGFGSELVLVVLPLPAHVRDC